MRKVMYPLEGLGGLCFWIRNVHSHGVLCDAQIRDEALSHAHLKWRPTLQRRHPALSCVYQTDTGIAPVRLDMNSLQKFGCSRSLATHSRLLLIHCHFSSDFSKSLNSALKHPYQILLGNCGFCFIVTSHLKSSCPGDYSREAVCSPGIRH